MNGMALVLFVLGLAFLVLGGELVIRGASRTAARLGIPPLVIGLTVVAYGTSAPELAVSVQSAFGGQADIAIGNVVGSNVFNILFVLGLSAVLTPLVVAQQLVRFDVPLLIGASVLMEVLGLDGRLGRLDGLLLFAGVLTYTVVVIRQSRKPQAAPIDAEYEHEYGRSARSSGLLANLLLIAGGVALLVVGSRWLVAGAVTLARSLGVSELIIGLTIVAVGTSLPEVVTSVVAALRGERDIAVGNAVGSSIFNILSVLGLASLLSPTGIAVSEPALHFDIPVMIAVAVACLPVFFTGYVIARWEGLLFLTYYGIYTLYLVLAATHHDALPAFSLTMAAFILPLTAVTLVTLALRALHPRSVARGGPPSG